MVHARKSGNRSEEVGKQAKWRIQSLDKIVTETRIGADERRQNTNRGCKPDRRITHQTRGVRASVA